MDKTQKVASHKLQATRNYQKIIGRTILFLIAIFSTFFVKAQDTVAQSQTVDMATGMRSNGKIYVVVAVLCIILAGVFLYLINLDKKISKLEKETDA